MRLRLIFCLFLTFCLLTCAGCFSIDIRTELDRRGGGKRSYLVTLDPVISRLYRGTEKGGTLFNLPGQGLDKRPGIELLSQRKTETAEGGLKLEWVYQASKLDLFSNGQDSILVITEKRGIWVYRTYLEKILPGEGPGKNEFPVSGGYRVRHVLSMPGQVLIHDADSQAGRELVWNKPSVGGAGQAVIMSATSREINPLHLVVLSLAVLSVAAILSLMLTRKFNELCHNE